MNWVDLVIIIILLFFALEGLGRPLFYEIYDLFSFIAAFLLSLRFYNYTASLFERQFSVPHSLANVLGFITIWYGIEVLLFLTAQYVFRKHHRVLHFPGGRVLSVIPSFCKGVIFVAILLVLAATFPIQPKLKNEVNSSKLGSLILSKTYQLESPIKGVFGGLANDTLTFLTVKPKTNESVNLGFKTNNFTFDENLEFAMADLVNKERLSMGLGPLVFDTRLRTVARGHSADMFKRGYFSHYSPEGHDVVYRAEQIGIDYLVLGENLAYAPTLELAHNGLMNSPGHRANILSSDYHKIGIGAANASDYGLMFTQVFTN
jgi:uncharacterized protein YkwD